MDISLQVSIKNGETFGLQAKKKDTILKIKSRIFIKKNIPPENQKLSFAGLSHSDDKTFEEIDFDVKQKVKLVVDEQVSALKHSKWESIAKGNLAYICIKDQNGEEILKQYGKKKPDGVI